MGNVNQDPAGLAPKADNTKTPSGLSRISSVSDRSRLHDDIGRAPVAQLLEGTSPSRMVVSRGVRFADKLASVQEVEVSARG